MKIFDSYINMWKNGINYKDRTNKKNFWIAIAIHVIIYIFLAFVDKLLNIPSFDLKIIIISGGHGFYSLIALIPLTAIICRRFHDINKSGWNLLVYEFVSILIVIVTGILIITIGYISNYNYHLIMDSMNKISGDITYIIWLIFLIFFLSKKEVEPNKYGSKII